MTSDELRRRADEARSKGHVTKALILEHLATEHRLHGWREESLPCGGARGVCGCGHVIYMTVRGSVDRPSASEGTGVSPSDPETAKKRTRPLPRMRKQSGCGGDTGAEEDTA